MVESAREVCSSMRRNGRKEPKECEVKVEVKAMIMRMEAAWKEPL